MAPAIDMSHVIFLFLHKRGVYSGGMADDRVITVSCGA